MTQPSRATFWRFLFLVTLSLALASLGQVFGLAPKLGVNLAASRAWQGLLAGLSLIGAFALLALLLSYSRHAEKIPSLAESLDAFLAQHRWMGSALLFLSLIGFILIFRFPFLNVLGGNGWMRYLILWFFSLLGMLALKAMRRELPWLVALIAMVLFQAVLQLLLVYWNRVSTYPFAMGWSETSRFYFPSLFLSRHVYGTEYPWPILHPTLHLLLAPPYLFDAPLWVHRFWQVAIRYVLLGAMVPPLLKRLSIPNPGVRWLAGLWMFLFLFMGPVYFHLAVPVILVLWGFSLQDGRRTWLVVILASLWCGWSRVNWYPLPGMIAAVLYLIESPVHGKRLFAYLSKPALWFIVGIATAFLAQRIYIALSGVSNSALFYTSLSSDLLWYRLLPNASYRLGILPAAFLASLPAWIAMGIVVWQRKADWHPVRLLLLLAAALILFLGGLVVSLKIGGGANLHNMDAYFTLLLIVFAYLVFAGYRRENGEMAEPVRLPWLVVVALIVMPAWSWLQYNINFTPYDANRTQAVLAQLQEKVNEVNAQGGEILFITQRHLISMHMLKGVRLIPEYEREDLMEMAMANNTVYLDQFRQDMRNQRFALIVVDPLNFNLMTRSRGFAEENNVWVTRVMKWILCNYREAALFPEDDLALYVPQAGERVCPQK